MRREPGLAGKVCAPSQGCQGMRQAGSRRRRRRQVHAQVDRRIAGRLRIGGGGDEGAAPDPAAQQAEALGLAVGAGNGSDADAEVAGQVALRRHADSGPEQSGADIASQRLHDLVMQGPAFRLDIRCPGQHETVIEPLLSL